MPSNKRPRATTPTARRSPNNARRSPKEIARSERASDRYQDAFEAGDLNPAHFNECLSTLKARLDDLHDQRPSTRPRTSHRRTDRA
jgi:hypothetical protein